MSRLSAGKVSKFFSPLKCSVKPLTEPWACRFGTRCKFQHQLSQEQPAQRNAFDTAPRQSQQGLNTNRFGPLSDAPNANAQSRQQQQPLAKDHRCNNPKVCQELMKEDVKSEQPTFWRLTSYAHYKFLPNDICGDISPEELRSVAYDNARQGVTVYQVVQNEQALVAGKKAEFDALLRNPYQGPQSKNSSGFGQGNASPFLSATQPSTNTVFGVAQNAPTSGFGKPQTLFGVQSSALQQPVGSMFNKTGPIGPAVGATPFQAAGFGQSVQNALGAPSSAPQNIFGTQNKTVFGNGNTAFGGGSGAFGTQSPFNTVPNNTMTNASMSPFSAPPATTMSFSQSPFVSAPPANTMSFSQSPFVTPAVGNSDMSLPMSSTSNAPKDSTEGDQIWVKDTWKLGEIPEDEPPEQVR